MNRIILIATMIMLASCGDGGGNDSDDVKPIIVTGQSRCEYGNTDPYDCRCVLSIGMSGGSSKYIEVEGTVPWCAEQEAEDELNSDRMEMSSRWQCECLKQGGI